MVKPTRTILVLAIIATIVFGAWATVRTVAEVSFDLNCGQYLKRAADANSVEMAKEELKNAISYAESNNLTDGIVSIFLKQPKNDIGFWYRNLNKSLEELESLPQDCSALEKTNVLMKLRESLTDDSGESGTSITLPNGISVYPNNVAFFCWGLISGLLACGLWILWSVAKVNDWDYEFIVKSRKRDYTNRF